MNNFFREFKKIVTMYYRVDFPIVKMMIVYQ